MQDPSNGLPPQLMPHMHLISAHRYPTFHQLNIDQAYQFLFEAPKVVKQIAPMAWQYLAGPPTGTVFLTWIGGRMQGQFASDGYVWIDQEQRYTQDVGGYTLEVAVQHSGYRPGIDNISSYARKRYRFVSKNPSVTALPPDPSLWVVHYSQADPQNCIPVNQLPMTPQVRQQLQERQWIESQGRLEQQAFMLHDREKWPHVNLPGRNPLPGGPMYNPSIHAQNPMAHVGNPRFSGQFYQQPAQQPPPGPSPAKRQRQHAPPQMPPSAAALMATDTSIEDEENVLLGDILDHLTQREISMTRYMQHHEWMEEVFSSPYATGNIIPADLGFGLMGELAALTDGILEPPSPEQEKALAKGAPAPEYKKVTPDQLHDFEARVKAHMEKGQAEIQRMKEEHSRKMDSLKRNKTLVQAEKRLRNALWDPTDTGNEVWRFERAANVAPTHDAASRPKEAAEDIVKEVETLLGGTIKPQREASLIERGGLREKVAAPSPLLQPPPPSAPVSAVNGDTAMIGATNGNDVHSDGSFSQQTQMQTTVGLEQQQQQQQQHHPQQPPHATNTSSEATPQQHQPQTLQHQPPHTHQQNTSSEDAELGSNELMMDDDHMSLMDDINMDMDVDTTNLNFDDATSTSPKPVDAAANVTTGGTGEWQQQNQSQEPSSQIQPGRGDASTSASSEARAQPAQAPLAQAAENNLFDAGSTAPTTTTTTATNNVSPTVPAAAAVPTGSNNVETPADAATSAFTDFDAGIDNDDDGLIDFDGGSAGDMGFDMDDSAFGDAFHGTETLGQEDGNDGGLGDGHGHGDGEGAAGQA